MQYGKSSDKFRGKARWEQGARCIYHSYVHSLGGSRVAIGMGPLMGSGCQMGILPWALPWLKFVALAAGHGACSGMPCQKPQHYPQAQQQWHVPRQRQSPRQPMEFALANGKPKPCRPTQVLSYRTYYVHTPLLGSKDVDGSTLNSLYHVAVSSRCFVINKSQTALTVSSHTAG